MVWAWDGVWGSERSSIGAATVANTDIFLVSLSYCKTGNNGLFQIFQRAPNRPPPYSLHTNTFRAGSQRSHPALNWWLFGLFILIKVHFQGPTFLRALMPSTSPMYHSTKKTKPTGFSKVCERELVKIPSYNSSGGVQRNRSLNFNHRHHQHFGTRKSQGACKKRRHTGRTSELVFMTQNVQLNHCTLLSRLLV